MTGLRRKFITISDNMWPELFGPGVRRYSHHTDNPIPADARCVGAWHDAERAVVKVVLESESFATVHDGDPIPEHFMILVDRPKEEAPDR